MKFQLSLVKIEKEKDVLNHLLNKYFPDLIILFKCLKNISNTENVKLYNLKLNKKEDMNIALNEIKKVSNIQNNNDIISILEIFNLKNIWKNKIKELENKETEKLKLTKKMEKIRIKFIKVESNLINIITKNEKKLLEFFNKIINKKLTSESTFKIIKNELKIINTDNYDKIINIGKELINILNYEFIIQFMALLFLLNY